MKIVQISPGSGNNYYCENCLRDAALIKAMRSLGHDVIVVPLYLPLQVDKEELEPETPVFFGGVNVYLQQKLGLFRKTPRWLDRALDSRRLLRWAGRKEGMTNARDLAETTISMLSGEQGRQVKELQRLIQWLDTPENRPDIVCLSNVLLSGLAPTIKDRLKVPVVCLLQDEEGFLDSLPKPYAEQAWKIASEKCRKVDLFVAVSRFYGELMRARLGLTDGRLRTVYMGIPLDDFKSVKPYKGDPTIGFLSRMCPDKGLDLLVEAFLRLKNNGGHPNLKLKVAGGKLGTDRKFVEANKSRIQKAGFGNDAEFYEDFGRETKRKMLETLTVVAVPERHHVACGLYVLEALAAGVPVVQPASGVFPELVEMTGGGVLYEHGNVDALAEALNDLLVDNSRARKLGQTGKKTVFEKFDIEQTAAELVGTFQTVAESS